MAKRFSATLGTDKLGVTTDTVSDLGGTIGLQVIIDGTVTPSRQDAILMLRAIEQRIVEDTWPAS